jgi:hypothetical protein
MASCACSVSLRFGPRFSICIPLFGKKKENEKLEGKPLLSSEISLGDLQTRKSRFAMYGAFTMMGLALSLLWGCLSFQASIYNVIFGEGTWALMIVVYNAPGLASLVFQLVTDDFFEHLAKNKSNVWSVRVFLSLALCLLCCVAAPFVLLQSRELLLAFVAIVGIVVGLAHGWLYSFAGFFFVLPVLCFVAL